MAGGGTFEDQVLAFAVVVAQGCAQMPLGLDLDDARSPALASLVGALRAEDRTAAM